MAGHARGINIGTTLSSEREAALDRAFELAKQVKEGQPSVDKEPGKQPARSTNEVETYVSNAVPALARAKAVESAPQHKVASTTPTTADLVRDKDAQGYAKPMTSAPVGASTVTVESHPGSSLGVPSGTSVAVGTSGLSGYIPSDAGVQLANLELQPQPYRSGDAGWTGKQVSRKAPVAANVEDEQRQQVHRLESAKIMEDRYSYRDAQGQAIIQQHGRIEKPLPRNTNSKSAKRFRKSFKEFRTRTKERIKRKIYAGDTFMDFVQVDATLLPNEVGLGIEDIIEALNEPNCPIVDLVREKLIARYGGDPTLTREDIIANPQILINLLNGVRDPKTGGFKRGYAPLDIEVTLDKSPVNHGPSIQVRTLRIHSGHGIYLHPTQVTGFNADFDGDQPTVNLDQGVVRQHRRSMSYLIDAEGRPMVDMKFFPLDEASADGIEQMVRCMRERDFSWLPEDVNIRMLAEAYVKLCNSEKKELDSNWVDLLKELDAIASDLTAAAGITSDDMIDKARADYLARLFGAIYDFSVTRRKLSLKTQYSALYPTTADEQDTLVPGRETLDPMVWHLVAFHDDVAMGRRAPNFQAFAKGLHRSYGIEDNANIPFRLVADFAKAIGRTDAIQIGDDIHGIYQIQNADGTIRDSISVEELWRFTCSCAVTTAISGEMRSGSRDVAISTTVKTMVIKEMGPVPDWSQTPEDQIDDLYRDWISRFVDCYNKHMRMLNVSQVSWRYDMTPTRDGATKFDGIPEGDGKALAGAIVKIYGEMTVGEFFPVTFRSYNKAQADDSRFHEMYRDMQISSFVYQCRLPNNSDKNGKYTKLNAKGEVVGKFRGEIAEERYSDGSFLPSDILYLVADRRTKETGDYKQEWLKATEAHFNRIDIRKIRKHAKKGEIDEYMSDIMECLYLMGPDMFDHFGMISPETFLRSKYGKRFFESKTLDEFRSNLISMEVEYRLSHASRILDEIAETEFTDDLSKLNDLELAFEYEIDALGSSSMVWDSLVKEMFEPGVDGRTAYQRLAQTKKYSTGHPVLNHDFWDGKLDVKPTDFDNVVEFLKSDAPFDLKMSVLQDITRESQQFIFVSENEMLGQLMHEPNRLHSGDRFNMNMSMRDQIDAIKESSERALKYAKSREDVKKGSRKIIKQAKKNKTGFEQMLLMMANDPGYHVYIDPILAADALASVYDPTYSDSEKIRQQGSVNGYFECVSYQRSGGFYTHLHQTDNAVVNMIGADQLSAFDIVRIIGDPSIEVYLYDDFGCPTGEAVSRRTLCGGDTIDDVIRFLSDHPKIAMATRRMICGISTTGKNKVNGAARVSAIDDWYGIGMDAYSRVFSLLCDRPRFLAIANLTTPANENVSRNMPELLDSRLKNICYLIAQMATSDQTTLTASADYVLEMLGISKKQLMEIRLSDFERHMGNSGVDSQAELDSLMQTMVDEVVQEVLDCVSLVRSENNRLASLGLPILTVGMPKDPKIEKGSVDESSIRAYYAAKQQLGGARTAKMISIEGGETKRNLVLKEYLRSAKPVWTMTEDGPVRLPDDAQYYDQSMEMMPERQINPIAKFLEIKREKGAEDFNAKAKKFGDDNTNSIIKFTRMATRGVMDRYGCRGKNVKNGTWSIEDGIDLRARVESAGRVSDISNEEEVREKKDAAVAILADALRDADIRLGYIDLNDSDEIADDSFMLSDYYERAEMMIAYNSDGTLVIRSLEQIALACEARLSDFAIMSEDESVMLVEISQIIDTLGTDRDSYTASRTSHGIATDCILGAQVLTGAGQRFRAERAIREHSSREKPAYDLLLRIRQRYESMCIDSHASMVGSNDQHAKNARNTFYRLQDAIPSNMRGSAIMREIKKVALPKGKKPGFAAFRGDNDYSYNLAATSSTLQASLPYVEPGPLSMVVFEPGWSRDEVESKQPTLLDEGSSPVSESPIEICRKLGLTAAFTSLSDIPREYLGDAMRISEHIWILPFFDMELNGSLSTPGAFAPGEYIANPSNFTVMYEDTTFDMKPGDSTVHFTRECIDRTRVFKHRTEIYSADVLFPNTIAAYPKSLLKLDYCTLEEIEDIVLNGEFDPETGMIVGGAIDAIIDLGIDPKDSGYNREARRFSMRLDEYRANLQTADSTGVLTCECKPDSIIGFAKIIIDGRYVALAPITAFHLEKSGKVLQSFKVDKLELQPDTQQFVMSCHYEGGLMGHLVKFFEGIGASNKMMASTEVLRSRKLQNGLSVDGAYSSGTVSSRLFSSNKRISTMISMMMVTRMDAKYAYNFAEVDGAFPGDPVVVINGSPVPVKEALLDCTMSNELWKQATGWTPEKGCRPNFFHKDPEIDAFVRYWVDLCFEYGTVNPTTLLATKSRTGMMVPRCTEFEAFMDTSINFQNAFMKFMNLMTRQGNGSAICPPSIDGNASKCLFKPVTKDALVEDEEYRKQYRRYKDEDYGVLQMLVPHFDEDTDETYYVPENVFISMGFFGEEFTGFKKKNFNAYHESIDNLNVAHGNINGFTLSQMMAFARGSMGHQVISGAFEVIPDTTTDGYGTWYDEDL